MRMNSVGAVDRYKYLTLGFFAQDLIGSLIRFTTEGAQESLQEKIDRAIARLDHAEKSTVPSERGFSSYRELRTLQSVRDVTGGVEIKNTLQAISDGLSSSTGESAKDLYPEADSAIVWLGRLHAEALRNYSSGAEPTPSDLQALCNVAP